MSIVNTSLRKKKVCRKVDIAVFFMLKYDVISLMILLLQTPDKYSQQQSRQQSQLYNCQKKNMYNIYTTCSNIHTIYNTFALFPWPVQSNSGMSS